MSIFYTNLALIFMYWIISKLVKNKMNVNKILLKVIFFQLFLILALRDINTGTDTHRYIELYDTINVYSINELSKIYNKEFGFIILTKIIQFFTESKQIYIGIIAIITLLGPYKFIKNNSENIFLSIIIYISFEQYAFVFSGLRQAIAISIFLLGFDELRQNNIYKYIIYIIIASTFHKTVLITLLLIPLRNLKLSDMYFKFSILVIISSVLFKGPIISYIMKYLYSEYSNTQNSGGGYSILAVIFILVWLGYIYGRRYFYQNKANIIFYTMLMLSLIFQIYASIEGNINRIVSYFNMSIIIYIPLFINFFKDRKFKVLLTYIVVVIFITRYMLSMNSSALLNSYNFFWR